jgi:hypothetical protein
MLEQITYLTLSRVFRVNQCDNFSSGIVRAKYYGKFFITLDGREFNGTIIQSIASKQKAKAVDSEFEVSFRGTLLFEMK